MHTKKVSHNYCVLSSNISIAHRTVFKVCVANCLHVNQIKDITTCDVTTCDSFTGRESSEPHRTTQDTEICVERGADHTREVAPESL